MMTRLQKNLQSKKKLKISVFLLSAFLILMTNSPVRAEVYIFNTQWGGRGSGNGQFSYPYGVAVSKTGSLYVTDTGNSRIQKFNSKGEFILAWGSKIPSDATTVPNGQFLTPKGIAVNRNDEIYIVDSTTCRVQKFTSDGTYITSWGNYGEGNGEFMEPEGIAVDESGNVYIADMESNRIEKFTSEGTFITAWGTSGNGNGQFSSPWGVAADVSGNIYVIESNNNRVQKFDGNGAFISTWGTHGSANGQFVSPWGIAVDSAGNVYVADNGNNRVQKFDGGGSFITGWGKSGAGSGKFQDIWGIAVDNSGSVFVADYGNNLIQKFLIETSVSSNSAQTPTNTQTIPSPSIPEFPSFAMLTLVLVAIAVTATIYKGKHDKSRQT